MRLQLFGGSKVFGPKGVKTGLGLSSRRRMVVASGCQERGIRSGRVSQYDQLGNEGRCKPGTKGMEMENEEERDYWIKAKLDGGVAE